MSTNDRIQLKREQVVGNEVALEDINPKTNTKSIDDSNSGVSLDETIDRLWNSINNKLSRIVNSVNGRTGVVILSSEDVGLGNVDNVSYADIKKWVIERLAQEFNTKRIKLFESLDEVETFINEHQDKAYADIAYYSHHGYTDPTNVAYDLRGYIGYIYFDEDHQVINHAYKAIDSIGYTDNSVLYNEKIEYDEPGVADKDLHGGGLGVNIWKYEDALEIYNDASGHKADSGLRIKKEKIVANVYYFDGVYGNGTASDPDAFLYYDTSSLPADVKTVTFKIDGVELTAAMISSITNTHFGGINYSKQDFRINDIIICNFNDENYIETNPNHGPDSLISDLMNPLLMNRNPAIGKVTVAPTLENPNDNYTIEFYSIKPNTYRGLKKYMIHTEQYDSSTNGEGYAIGLDMLQSRYIKSVDDIPQYTSKPTNISGLNAFAPYTANNPLTSVSDTDREYSTILPSGMSSNIFAGDSSGNSNSSTYILPNFSLCVIPRDAYAGNNNHLIPNWPTQGPTTVDPCDGDGYEQSLIGVNLDKYVHHPDSGDGHAVNISGLRVSDMSALTPDWFGDGTTNISENHHSGGLSVNVGAFLEIGSFGDLTTQRTEQSEFYDEGKVNVRVDTMKGLDNVGDNKLGIKLCDTNLSLSANKIGGLTFTPVDSSYPVGCLTINPGPGVYLTHDYGAKLNGTGYVLLTGTRPPDWPTSATPSTKYFKNIGTAEEPEYVGVTSSDSYAANTYYEYMGIDSPMAPLTDDTALTIGIVDTLNTAMYGYQALERKKYYGGLRFATIPQSSIPATSCISIRVNDSDQWYGNNDIDPITSSPTDLTNLHRGTKGLCIDSETNVLGIMLSQTHANENVLHIKSLRQAAEEYISGKVFMAKSSMIYATTASFPVTGESDRLYITYENGYPEHYVWDETNGVYEHFIILINTATPWVKDESIIQRIRNRLYVYVNGLKSAILSYGLMKNVFYPDVNSDDQITSVESGVVANLVDLTAEIQHNILNNELFNRLDLNKDGVITQDDADLINNYIDTRTADNYTEFEEYMRDKGYINPQPTDPEHWYYLDTSFIWTIHGQVDLNFYHNISEGAGVDANMHGGIRTSTNGILTTSNASGTREIPLSRINLEVNIDDRTSRKGIWEYNRYTAGGLRFGSGGVLAVRINNEARYNNIDGSGLDDLHHGTKGLCIDENNVLGIQCAPGETGINVNGELAVFNRFVVDYVGDNVQYKSNTLLVDRTNATAPDIYLALQDFYSTTIAGDIANGNIVKIAQTITS